MIQFGPRIGKMQNRFSEDTRLETPLCYAKKSWDFSWISSVSAGKM